MATAPPWTHVENVPLRPGEIHVWLAPLDVPPPKLENFLALLDGGERDRAARYRRPEDRRRFIAAHGLLRVLLGRYLTMDPAGLQFTVGRWGKPALSRAGKAPDIRFSLSRSGDFGLCAVACGREVGADLEGVRPDFDWEPIAQRFFSPAERAAIAALPAAARPRGFFEIWTCKEAFLKATGEGFSRSPERFEIFSGPGVPDGALPGPFASGVLGVRFLPPAPVAAADAWTLRRLDPGSDLAAAVAAQGSDWTVALWKAEL